MRNLAKLVSLYRKKNGLTQIEMAKQIGAKYAQVISGIENMRISPTLQQTRRLAAKAGRDKVLKAMMKDHKEYLLNHVLGEG